MTSWVLNVGEGAYRLAKYDEDVTDKITFGFEAAGSDQKPYTGWEPEEAEEVIEIGWDKPESAIEYELTDTEESTLNGISEYAIGFWSRFLWNGGKSKLVDKPDWMGLTRISMNKDF